MDDQESEARGATLERDIQPTLADLGEGAALVAAGATLMRVENDAMLAVAIQRPRDEDKVLEGAMRELERYPDLAAESYYSMQFSEERGSDRKVEIAGTSIGGAMALARRWGNCSVRAYQTGEDDEQVYLSGVFTDLETNFRVERPLAVSKIFRFRDGRTESLGDRKKIQAIQAGASKAMRNATIAGLPRGLVRTYYERTRSVAAREAKAKWSKLLEAFREFGVTRELLEAHLGHPIEKVSDEKIADLRGAYNALRDGIDGVTALDLFPPKKPAEEGEDATGTAEQAIAAGAEVTGGAEKPAEPAEELAGEAGAELIATTGYTRAKQIGVAPEELLAAVARRSEVESLEKLPKAELGRAILLASSLTAEAIRLGPGGDLQPPEEATPAKPDGPPNVEVSKGGEEREKKDVGF